MIHAHINAGSVLTALIAVIFICAAPGPSFANAPKNVALEYDAASQTLSVAITHPSAAPGWHYIKTVAIKKSGAEVSTNTYEKQPDADTFTYTYKVEAKAGDTLEVTATCSLFGHKTVTLTVGGETK
jgi:hypothetical protein